MSVDGMGQAKIALTFMDETGDPGVIFRGKGGGSKRYFIVIAVLVPSDCYVTISQNVELYFQKSLEHVFGKYKNDCKGCIELIKKTDELKYYSITHMLVSVLEERGIKDQSVINEAVDSFLAYFSHILLTPSKGNAPT